MSVSEGNPNVFHYPEEDSVLGQHETSLNETNIAKKFAMSPQTLLLLLPYNK